MRRCSQHACQGVVVPVEVVPQRRHDVQTDHEVADRANRRVDFHESVRKVLVGMACEHRQDREAERLDPLAADLRHEDAQHQHRPCSLDHALCCLSASSALTSAV